METCDFPIVHCWGFVAENQAAITKAVAAEVAFFLVEYATSVVPHLAGCHFCGLNNSVLGKL
jgi:hypothetical protein